MIQSLLHGVCLIIVIANLLIVNLGDVTHPEKVELLLWAILLTEAANYWKREG